MAESNQEPSYDLTADTAPSPEALPPADPSPHTPSHLHLYVLIAGLFLGVLIGPQVLGTLSPETYQQYFPSLYQAHRDLATYDASAMKRVEDLISTGVTQAAIQEFNDSQGAKRLPFLMNVVAAQQPIARILAGMVAVIILMVFETLSGRRAFRTRRWLVSTRYVLMALTIALLLAQPDLFAGFSMLLVAMMVLAGLTLAMIPLSMDGSLHQKTGPRN